MVEKMQEKIDMKTMIHSIIGVAIMLGISNMTPIEPVTTIGMHVGGIFLGLIYLWTTVGIFWPTLLGIVLLGLTDGIGMDTMFTAFSAYIALLILFCMFFCGAVADSGLTQYIAHWFLSRKFINGHPIVFNIMIMTAIYVVSGVIDALAAALVVWPIMYATLEKVGYTKDEKYPRVLTVCSFIALSLGICLLPIWGAMAAMVEVFENASGMHVSYLSYILLNTIVGFVIIVVMSFMIKYVFHCDLTKMENITIEDICSEKLPPMSKTQIVYAIATVIFFLVAILPSVLPQEWPAVIWLNKLTLIGFSQLKFLYPLKTLVFPAFSPPRFGPFPSFFPLREEMRETFFRPSLQPYPAALRKFAWPLWWRGRKCSSWYLHQNVPAAPAHPWVPPRGREGWSYMYASTDGSENHPYPRSSFGSIGIRC